MERAPRRSTCRVRNPDTLFRNSALARDVSTNRRGEPRRFARGGDRAGACSVLRGLRRRGDRPLLRERGRLLSPAPIWQPGERRSNRSPPSSTAASRSARRSRGSRTGRAAAARAPRGVRPRRAVGRRVRPCRDRVREARSRRPRCALRRLPTSPSTSSSRASTTTSAVRSSARKQPEHAHPGVAGCRRSWTSTPPPAPASRRAATPSISTSRIASGT